MTERRQAERQDKYLNGCMGFRGFGRSEPFKPLTINRAMPTMIKSWQFASV